MRNDFSNVNDSKDDYYPYLVADFEKIDCWQFLAETVLALPRHSKKEKLIFYIEEGRRMEGREALSRMQQIVFFLLPRVKKWRLPLETQQTLDGLRYYLDHSSAVQTAFSL